MLKSITVIYMPTGYTTSDDTAIYDIEEAGGLFIIYKIDDANYEPNREEWIKRFVDERPDIRRIEIINGNPAIINKGNPELGMTAQVLMWRDNSNLRVNIVSLVFDDAELKRVAESIQFKPDI